jgi:hypothetical protein
VNDYVALSNSYNRNFKFLDQDSTVAYIQVKSFSGVFSSKFYKETFRKIKKADAKYLIIDIRNNYGGSLEEINNLYSYLSSEPYTDKTVTGNFKIGSSENQLFQKISFAVCFQNIDVSHFSSDRLSARIKRRQILLQNESRQSI